MANWWDEAPIVGQVPAREWWEDAPLVEAQQPAERGIGQRVYDNIVGDPSDGVDSFGERVGRTMNDMGAAGMAGVSRGVTGMLDMPGMIFGGGQKLGMSGLEAAGVISPEVAEGGRQAAGMGAAGDGALFGGAMSGATGGASEYRGQTTAGQYAGTVGEFLPGSFMPGAGMARQALAFGVAPGIASEAAGQMTEGTAAEPYARIASPVLAGALAGRLTGPRPPQAPSRNDLSAQAEGLYRAGDARPAADPQSVAALRLQMDNTLRDNSRMTPTGRVTASGNVKSFLDVLDDYQGQVMKPAEIQNVRSYLTDAAKSADAGERRIAMKLLDEFDGWRAQVAPEFDQADKLYGRVKRSDDVENRVEKAERRAASSGTGGNAVNTARQNIRQILDNPKARRGYSEEETEAMEQIVRGTTATNALRTVGRLSPTSGALPLMGNIASVGINPAFGIAAMGAAAGAKGLSEVLTSRQIKELSELIRNGGPVGQAPGQAVQSALSQLLALRSVNAGRE